MVTKEQVLDQVSRGASYEEIGRQFDIPAGQAYMIATGIPADSGDSVAPEDRSRPGFQAGGTQALVGVPFHNPDDVNDKPEVMEWVRQRAKKELSK